MRTLIIPDVHLKISRAQRIIDANPDCDRRVFLGDIYDDFGDDIEKTKAAARWHKEQLADPKNEFVWGNHDLHYAFGHNRKLQCSGYARYKAQAISEIMTGSDWKPTKFYVEVDGWLISHAGLRADYADKDLASEAQVALRNIAVGGEHWMIAAGYARGGGWKLGGLIWLDWNLEFEPIPGIKQIVGHTPGKQPREKDGNWCLDTHLRHAAIIEDDKLEVFEAGA